jgi:hypothetical protein
MLNIADFFDQVVIQVEALQVFEQVEALYRFNIVLLDGVHY